MRGNRRIRFQHRRTVRGEGRPEAVDLAKFDEPANVVAAFPVERALGRLELVPENVDADGVEAHRPGFFDAVFPELIGYAGEMDFPAMISMGWPSILNWPSRAEMVGFTVARKGVAAEVVEHQTRDERQKQMDI